MENSDSSSVFICADGIKLESSSVWSNVSITISRTTCGFFGGENFILKITSNIAIQKNNKDVKIIIAIF